MVFTTRFSGGKGGRNHLETELRQLNVTQKNGHPGHPQTQGKVERFQQTLKKWLRGQPDQPRHPHRTPGPHRHLRRPLQPPAAAPFATTPGDPRHHLQHAAQSHPDPRPQPRYPRPNPPRQDRQSRQRHPARRRTGSATSASDEPTPEPTSSCSSTTCTSASSTPPPANSSASSPSIHDRDYQPTGRPPGPPKKK